MHIPDPTTAPPDPEAAQRDERLQVLYSIRAICWCIATFLIIWPAVGIVLWVVSLFVYHPYR